MQEILPLGIPKDKYNNTTNQIYTYTKILILHLEVCLQNILKIFFQIYSNITKNYPVITRLLPVTPQFPTESHFTQYNPLIPSGWLWKGSIYDDVGVWALGAWQQWVDNPRPRP